MRRLDPLAALVGVWALAWGAWLLAPWQTFDSSPAFERLHDWGPEWAWGFVALLCGIAIVQPRRGRLRFGGFCGAVLLSGCLVATFVEANPRGTSAPTYGTLLLACMWGLIVGTRDL